MKDDSTAVWLNREPDGTHTLCAADGSTSGIQEVSSYAELLKGANTVYIAGSQANARLILDVRAELPGDVTIWTGSPESLAKATTRKQPLAIRLGRLHTFSPWFGGWRRVGEADLRLFRFLADYRPDMAAHELELLVQQHPAYPAISFLDCNLVAISHLLVAIGDPRWFNDPSHPDREARLCMFLGLTPKNLTAYLANSKAKNMADVSPHLSRLGLLLESLYDCRRHRAIRTVMQRDKGPSRFFHHPLQVFKADDTAFIPHALRRLGQLVSFIRQVWLHEVAPQGRDVFVPAYFFDKLGKHAKATVEAYERHRKRLPPKASAIVPS